jgi:hypothetical protein
MSTTRKRPLTVHGVPYGYGEDMALNGPTNNDLHTKTLPKRMPGRQQTSNSKGQTDFCSPDRSRLFAREGNERPAPRDSFNTGQDEGNLDY